MARLLVYLHLVMKQRALQGLLQQVLPGVEVTAVGRLADLERTLQAGQDAVLALPLVLNAKGLAPALSGIRAGANDERYVLAAADKRVAPTLVNSVGALDLLGRRETSEFIHQLVGARPKVERVTKVEDFLPLLQMQRAECICLAERLLEELAPMTRMQLVAHPLERRVGLPALAATGPRGAEIVQAVRGLRRDVNASLGVEGWQ